MGTAAATDPEPQSVASPADRPGVSARRPCGRSTHPGHRLVTEDCSHQGKQVQRAHDLPSPLSHPCPLVDLEVRLGQRDPALLAGRPVPECRLLHSPRRHRVNQWGRESPAGHPHRRAPSSRWAQQDPGRRACPKARADPTVLPDPEGRSCLYPEPPATRAGQPQVSHPGAAPATPRHPSPRSLYAGHETSAAP